MSRVQLPFQPEMPWEKFQIDIDESPVFYERTLKLDYEESANLLVGSIRRELLASVPSVKFLLSNKYGVNAVFEYDKVKFSINVFYALNSANGVAFKSYMVKLESYMPNTSKARIEGREAIFWFTILGAAISILFFSLLGFFTGGSSGSSAKGVIGYAVIGACVGSFLGGLLIRLILKNQSKNHRVKSQYRSKNYMEEKLKR